MRAAVLRGLGKDDDEGAKIVRDGRLGGDGADARVGRLQDGIDARREVGVGGEDGIDEARGR